MGWEANDRMDVGPTADGARRPPSGRRVAVAGGTTGLGQAIASAFVDLGSSVSICGRDPSTVATAVRKLRERGAHAWGRSVDVTVPGAVEAWLDDTHERRGPIDVLVANVGGNRDPESWETVFGDNLFWVVRAIDWSEQHFVAGGSIVLVSSIAARLPQLSRSEAAYGAAKAAVEHLTAHAAARLGPVGIRVNAVAPGPLRRPAGGWIDEPVAEQEFIDALQAASALGRFVTNTEVAACVTFLSDSAASGVTGSILRCDAGLEGRLP